MSTVENLGGQAGHGGADVPVNPFEALRVSYGMLLGEHDFQVLAGNARGKQMLHSSWLHGSGVVRGFDVVREKGGRRLQVCPGLAIDGIGRELRLEVPHCLDVDAWLADRAPGKCGETVKPVVAQVIAEFHACPTRPVPALADPCDVHRRQTEWSRVVETVRLFLREQERPSTPVPGPYHGVRMLLGLEHRAGSTDRVADEVAAELEAISKLPAAEQVAGLVAAFRRTAARDVTMLEPLEQETGPPVLFPVNRKKSEVVLATVTITTRGGTAEWECDVRSRRALLATSLIQELTCALAPGLLPTAPRSELGGPRVRRDSIGWEDARTLSFTLTKPVNKRTLRHEQVSVSSLGTSGGWLVEDIEVDGVEVVGSGEVDHVRLRLHQPPRHNLVRLVVRGTGPTPVADQYGVPLAGCDDGPPGTAHAGHDAVHQLRKYAAPGSADPAPEGSTP